MKAPASPHPVEPSGGAGPDPELVRAFGRAVRRNFAEQIAREEAEAETRRQRVVPVVRQAIERARNEGACGRAWLFGSYAWDRPGERSDVDILVENCPDPILVASIVGRACSLDVHVIDTREAPASLRDRAVAQGLPL
jgi:predicted nucleotidyltransferase